MSGQNENQLSHAWVYLWVIVYVERERGGLLKEVYEKMSQSTMGMMGNYEKGLVLPVLHMRVRALPMEFPKNSLISP